MLIGETARPYDLNAKELKWLCARGTKGKDKGFRFIVRHSATLRTECEYARAGAYAPIAPQEKILYVPQPDYSSQLMITELMLAKYCGAYLPSVPKPLVQTLAHIGKYYTPKFIEEAVRMTCIVVSVWSRCANAAVRE